MDMGKPIQQPEKLIISMVIGGLPIRQHPKVRTGDMGYGLFRRHR